MRKIKTLLMIVILGMLLVSCDNYNKNPKVDTEELNMMYEADTVQYLVVTDEDNNVTYFRIEDGRATPEVTIVDTMIAVPIVFTTALILWIGLMAYSIGKDQ